MDRESALIRRIKPATTLMDLLPVVLAIAGMIAMVVCMAVLGGLLGSSTNALQTGEWNDLTGGYEVLGNVFLFFFSLLGGLFTGVILILCAVVIGVFLVPSVHGIVLWARTDRLLTPNPESYLRFSQRDSIIKLIVNGLAFLVFLGDSLPLRTCTGYDIAGLLWFGIICGLEIYVLVLISRVRRQEPGPAL